MNTTKSNSSRGHYYRALEWGAPITKGALVECENRPGWYQPVAEFVTERKVLNHTNRRLIVPLREDESPDERDGVLLVSEGLSVVHPRESWPLKMAG